MSLHPGFPAVSEAATFLDIRRDIESEIAHDASGNIRSGVYPIYGTSPILSATSDSGPMTVDVAPFLAGLDRNGLVRVHNYGTYNVQISAAPGSGSRWSVVYVKQRESASPMSDGADGPVVDKVESTSSLSAARASIPAGGEEIGYVQVPAGVTTTNAVGVVVSTTIPFTAAQGGVVALRDSTEQAAWEPAPGSPAYRLDIDVALVRGSSGWGCVPHSVTNRRVIGTTNTFTNQTSYADFPASGDATALAMTFQKASDHTKLRVEVTGTAQLSSGTSQRAYIGIRVGSTDYDVAMRMFPTATSRENITGFAEIAGVPAGSLAIKPRFKAGGASQYQFFTDDFVAYTVTEVS